MPDKIKWRDAIVNIRAEYLAKRLWLGATIDVFLDEKIILSTDGQLKFNGLYTKEFEYQGSLHRIRVEWDKFVLRFVPCRIYIDEQEIAHEKVKIGNWQMMVLSQFVISLLILAVMFLCLVAIIVVKHQFTGG